jgi:hypothetical protein
MSNTVKLRISSASMEGRLIKRPCIEITVTYIESDVKIDERRTTNDEQLALNGAKGAAQIYEQRTSNSKSFIC